MSVFSLIVWSFPHGITLYISGSGIFLIFQKQAAAESIRSRLSFSRGDLPKHIAHAVHEVLDPAGRRDVMQTLHRLRNELGITVVLITHHMDEALQADRIVVISDGRIVLDGAPRDVFTHCDTLASYSLSAPETVLLLSALQDAGLDVPLTAMTPEACADAIAAALSE